MDRITLTAPLINNGRNVAFLVYGEGKANAVRQILEGERNPTLYPGQLIAPSKGKLYWFMDESAAKRIQH
jgi:6-phosphogluconolactonase